MEVHFGLHEPSESRTFLIFLIAIYFSIFLYFCVFVLLYFLEYCSREIELRKEMLKVSWKEYRTRNSWRTGESFNESLGKLCPRSAVLFLRTNTIIRKLQEDG